jgi:segregation and condensation protein B
MTELLENLNASELPVVLEALLFTSSGPVTLAQLGVFLGLPAAEIESGLHCLEASYEKRGLSLQWHAGKVQMTTAPRFGQLVEKFLGLESSSHLSRPALETLAIIAYQQPVTRPQIDAIRGVSSDGVLKSLLSKGLVQEEGRTEGPGRPIMYGTSADFMQYFGLTSLNQLPPLESFAESVETETKEFLKE